MLDGPRFGAAAGRLAPAALASVLAVGLLLFAALSGWRRWEREPPAVRWTQPVGPAIGRAADFELEVTDAGSGLRRVEIELVQQRRTIRLGEVLLPQPPWWRWWAVGSRRARFRQSRVDLSQHGLTQGPLEVVVRAEDRSLRSWGQGTRVEARRPLELDWTPPSVAVVSGPHYINQGGSELVILRVSDDAAAAGLELGSSFFPACEGQQDAPGLRMVFMPFPYNVDPATPIFAVARDRAGNAARSSFSYKVFPKRFQSGRIELDDAFLQAKVPEILSQSSEVREQGDLLASYLKINGELRRINNAQIARVAAGGQSRRLWSEPFLQLSNSQVESGFADHRSYWYGGRVVDTQDHLGFDLAVRERYPIECANDGVVAFAGWLGIYGQCVIVDHGCGLASLYGHLSELTVRPGQQVHKAEVLGRSGATGLAGGDHLHFTMILHGHFVNPIEWWDPHWVQVHVEQRLQSTASPATRERG